jgi:hypothetical protein
VIAFNSGDFDRFDSSTDQPSDEEILVVNTPQKRFYFKRHFNTDACAAEVGDESDQFFNDTLTSRQSHAATNTPGQFTPERRFMDSLEDNLSISSSNATHKPHNSLIIGELPANFLSDVHFDRTRTPSPSNRLTTHKKTRSRAQSNQHNVDFIDSPGDLAPPVILPGSPFHRKSGAKRSTRSSLQHSTPNPACVVPYLILPLSPTIKRIKIENNTLKSIINPAFSNSASPNLSPKKTPAMATSAVPAALTAGGIVAESSKQQRKKATKQLALQQRNNADDEDNQDDEEDDEEEEENNEEKLKETARKINEQLKKIDENKQKQLAVASGDARSNLSSSGVIAVAAAAAAAAKPHLEHQVSSGIDEGTGEIVREQWGRKIEFLLAIIGFSVDLGNIWRCNSIVYYFFILDLLLN